MEHSSSLPTDSPAPRRSFLTTVATMGLGAVITLTPLLSALAFFLDPILRRKPKFRGGDAEGYLPVTKLSDLPDDGTPLRFVLKADKIDAWNKFTDQSVGTVYLRKMPGNQIIAFNDTCPHLGCKVDFQESNKTFLCPCHASSFDLDGKRLNEIPPRPLDTLEWKTDADGKVWVKYQDFQCGVAQKGAVG